MIDDDDEYFQALIVTSEQRLVVMQDVDGRARCTPCSMAGEETSCSSGAHNCLPWLMLMLMHLADVDALTDAAFDLMP